MMCSLSDGSPGGGPVAPALADPAGHEAARAKVVPLLPGRRRVRREACPGPTAEILLFTGVRYERPVEQGPALQRRHS